MSYPGRKQLRAVEKQMLSSYYQQQRISLCMTDEAITTAFHL